MADPSFIDPPFPGERRLGPFLTAAEAQNQAASDLAYGLMTPEAFLGVFSTSESELRRDDNTAGTVEVPNDTILAQADSEKEAAAAVVAQAITDTHAMVATMLPEGTDVDQFLADQGVP